MLPWEPPKFSVCAAVCLLAMVVAGAAPAQTQVAEWSGEAVIDLGPGYADAIDNAGEASMVGADGSGSPAEWGEFVITLDGAPGWPGWMGDAAFVLNSAREAFEASGGRSTAAPSASAPSLPVPELSIWAMMFLGFAALGFAAAGRRSAGARSFPPD